MALIKKITEWRLTDFRVSPTATVALHTQHLLMQTLVFQSNICFLS